MEWFIIVFLIFIVINQYLIYTKFKDVEELNKRGLKEQEANYKFYLQSMQRLIKPSKDEKSILKYRVIVISACDKEIAMEYIEKRFKGKILDIIYYPERMSYFVYIKED